MHAGGDAGGMPVHAHDRAERLEQEGMGEATQKLVAAISMDDRLMITTPSRVMRPASHLGTRPPCSGRSALPVRRGKNPVSTAWGATPPFPVLILFYQY